MVRVCFRGGYDSGTKSDGISHKVNLEHNAVLPKTIGRQELPRVHLKIGQKDIDKTYS